MFYPTHWWRRQTSTVHHRIGLAIVTVLAFAAGLAIRPVVMRLFGSTPLGSEAAAPAIVAENSAAELRRAMELYREGEQAFYPRTEADVAPAASTELQRAMELYRQDERALSSSTVFGAAELQRAMRLYRQDEQALHISAVSEAAPAFSAGEFQRAMDLYRQGERALFSSASEPVVDPGPAEVQRAMELYREGERALFSRTATAAFPAE